MDARNQVSVDIEEIAERPDDPCEPDDVEPARRPPSGARHDARHENQRAEDIEDAVQHRVKAEIGRYARCLNEHPDAEGQEPLCEMEQVPASALEQPDGAEGCCEQEQDGRWYEVHNDPTTEAARFAVAVVYCPG
ncbi:hypothetical protein [Bosea sp. LC85]|uniref:hypothetical protein n=1 Tax=Bosea sp. LC85 TaxID=1502851 RepID=UPI00126A29A9|nr:hypothetical protein [Bosea sp. LC85]